MTKGLRWGLLYGSWGLTDGVAWYAGRVGPELVEAVEKAGLDARAADRLRGEAPTAGAAAWAGKLALALADSEGAPLPVQPFGRARRRRRGAS